MRSAAKTHCSLLTVHKKAEQDNSAPPDYRPRFTATRRVTMNPKCAGYTRLDGHLNVLVNHGVIARLRTSYRVVAIRPDDLLEIALA